LNLHPDLSFVAMVAHASVVVQAVMVLLLLLSLWSWWQIFLKMFALRRAEAGTDAFEDEFWKGGDLNALYQRASQSRDGGALERVFSAGFREFSKHRKQGSSSAATMDSARRAMRASYQREIDALEANLSGLATVGSVSPYIGLFGTVWGIMNAFRGLQSVSQATLAQVAPGIAEALIATALGLFAAIPAVVAYNRYTHDVDRLATRFETFIEEFSNILQRQG
jgi:biopolymer transport protein TolQ